MEASGIIFVLSFVGCALALPAPCLPPIVPSSCVTPNTPYSFFSSIYSSQSSYSYYSSDVCVAYGYDYIPDYIPTIMFEDMERQFMEAKCSYLNSFSNYYPRNIGPSIWDMTDDLLTYDFLMINSGAGALSALQELIEQGFSVAIVEEGLFAPAVANSMYYRNSLLNSPFVRPYETYIPGCDIPKKVYVPHCLGGNSIFDMNGWQYGSRTLYDNLSQYGDMFSWENAYSRFQKIERYEQSTTVTKETNVQVSSCGRVSISTKVRETSVTRSISSCFSELGFGNGFTPLDIDCAPGLSIVPSIGNGDSSLLYPQEIFSRLSCLDQIDLILGLRIERLIYDCGRISGVEVITPNGPKIIFARYDVILGSSPITMFDLLTRSGIGNPTYLNKFGIPVVSELPYLGQNLRANPIYFNHFVRFPRGVFVSEYESDFTSMDFMFGGSSMSSISSLSYYSAFLNVRQSQSANVMMRFYAFTRSMSKRIQYTLSYYFQLDYEIVQYVMSMCEEYDLLFMVPQLMAPKSCGHLEYGDSIDDLRVNLGMYSDEEDILAMMEAVQYIQQISSTSTFTSLGGELMTLPMSSLTGDYFSTDYIRQSLSYFSVPNLHVYGGAILGTDVSSSVVDSNFYIHGIPNLLCLSPAISPYPLYSDSIAFSSLLGSYGSEFIMNRYNSGFYDSFSSSSSSSSSYISNNGLGGTYSSTNTSNNMITNSGLGGLSGLDTLSTSSSDYEMSTRELDTLTTTGGMLGGSSMNGVGIDTMSSSMGSSMSGMGIDTMSSGMGSSMSGMGIDTMSSGMGSSMSGMGMDTMSSGVIGGSSLTDIDIESASSSSMSNSMSSNGIGSSYSQSEAESSSFSSDMVSSCGGLGSMQSVDSSYAASESESSSTTMTGNGIVSEYETAEAEASASSYQSTTAGPCGMQSISESTSESSASYESASMIAGC